MQVLELRRTTVNTASGLALVPEFYESVDHRGEASGVELWRWLLLSELEGDEVDADAAAAADEDEDDV